MKGVEWYLALEKCGTLTLESYNNVSKTDYLIAEMKCQSKNSYFRIKKEEFTHLKAYSCYI